MTRLTSPHNYWYDKYSHTLINILCILPNGVCRTLPKVQADLSLEDIKNILWSKESKYLTSPKSEYAFVVVSSKGGTEELVDEKLSLFDVKPVRPYLKVVRRQGDEQVKKMKAKINMLIGQNIATSKHEEVSDAQRSLTDFCTRISQQRGCSSWYRRAIYTFPPDFEELTSLPKNLSEKYPDCIIHLSVSVLKNSSNVFEVNYSLFPSNLIEKALRKRAQTLKKEFVEKPEDYILKVVGMESYFLGTVHVLENGEESYAEIPLIQYKYIRDCLLWDKRPMLVIIKKEDLEVCPLVHSTQDQPPTLLPKSRKSRRGGNTLLWELSPSFLLKVKILCAMDINSGNLWEEVRCGVFHGGEEVCEMKKTSSRMKGKTPKWNEWLEFNLPVNELPRMARLCFCIVGYQQQNQHRKPVPIGWVNFPLFNFKGVLHQGSFQLYCWQSNLKMNRVNNENFFNPLGTVMSSNDNGPCLVFELMNFKNTVVYPSEDIVLEIAAKCIEGVGADGENPLLVKGGKQHREQIEEIIRRDSLASMFEEDMELLWKLRAECCLEYPESLPKLLQCVKWTNHEHVAQVHFLLQSWRCDTLKIDIALELLDYKFPDLKVRHLAVQVLDNISDNKLEMYLLHLVQALKYESYLDSPLARYLLGRALNNRRIGHYLFWHLKADVGNPEFALQFGLLLELYCHAAVEHIDILIKQVEAINKMKTVTEILKGYKDQDREKKIEMMRECFVGYNRSFTDLISPLDPRKRLKRLRVEKCKYMDSKKKPLWLVFENYDDGADDVLIIFKNGDDLRQDMLTLLSLRLMDSVWKSSGLDYGIIPYRCLSTGPMVGLIEVVVNSETLGRIQAQRGVILGAWKEESLFRWLEEHCDKNEEKLEMFIQNFTRSVVGYSVAMYVLGVGDRHNDNIMMKYDTGQLFHIDFGHFLGNFKSKFGIKRERVKFVLTSDIVHAVQKSKNADMNENFNRFKHMCVEAFSCLRSHGNLFITVFAMLLSTGIPELKHPTDLDYLRDSLALLKDDSEARIHFGSTFDESYRKRGTTSVNFMFHNIKHNWSN